MPPVAHVDPVVEVGVFGGARWFGDAQLGHAAYAEQAPQDAGVVGLRVGGPVLPLLAIEAEGAYAPVDTPYGRASIFGMRGQLALRLARWAQVPHLLIGGGTETLRSDSPYLGNETSWVVYYGAGVTVPLVDGFELRVDVRHGIMAGRVDALASTLELQGSLQFAIGGGTASAPRTPRAVVVRAPAAVPATTPTTPALAPTPAPAPAVAAREATPPALTQALALAATMIFERGRARVTPAAGSVLGTLFAAVEPHGERHLVVVGHPLRIDPDRDLASRRAEAVKWYLVDLGANPAHIATRVGDLAEHAVTVELAPTP